MADDLEDWFAREILARETQLTRYLQRVWSNRDEIPDLRQETYVRVFDAAKTARPAQPQAFLFAIARHLMTDRLRRRRVIFIGARRELDALNVLVDEISPEQRLTSLEELTLLAQSFDRLPPRCRAVMWLRKVEQLSQKDVAARLGVHEKAVEKQVARGMRLLGNALLTGADGDDLASELGTLVGDQEGG